MISLFMVSILSAVPMDVMVRFSSSHSLVGGELSPVCAIVGGILGQEIIKVINIKSVIVQLATEYLHLKIVEKTKWI